MKKEIMLSIFILLFLIGCTTEEPEQIGLALGDTVEEAGAADTTFEIVNTHHYVNSIGYYHITGAIKNTGTLPAKHVRVVVTDYEFNGAKKVWTDTVVHPARLAPGEIGVFDKSVGKFEEYDVGRYEIVPGSYVIDEAWKLCY